MSPKFAVRGSARHKPSGLVPFRRGGLCQHRRLELQYWQMHYVPLKARLRREKPKRRRMAACVVLRGHIRAYMYSVRKNSSSIEKVHSNIIYIGKYMMRIIDFRLTYHCIAFFDGETTFGDGTAHEPLICFVGGHDTIFDPKLREKMRSEAESAFIFFFIFIFFIFTALSLTA